MNTLLNLAFFKTLGFPSKESGIDFIKQNVKLKKQIDEKVDELDEIKYNILEDVKHFFIKYEEKKEVYLIKIKSQKAEKIAHKKEITKMALKEEMKKELLEEIKNEEKHEKIQKLKKKYPKAFPNITDIDINNIEELFRNVLQKISDGKIDEDEIINMEKYKKETEKAFEQLSKIKKILENM